MKTKLIAILLMAGSSLFAETHFSFGVNLGGYGPGYYGPGYYGPAYYAPPAYYVAQPPPPVRYYAPPPAPGPEFTWVGGYWYPVGGRYIWHAGYWSRPPYRGAFWVGPRHEGRHFHPGYWGRR